MRITGSRALIWGALGALVFCAAAPVHAQRFPARPVRLVVPYPPGGANDIVARLLSP